MTTHRPERISDLIRGILARVLREEVRDPRIGFVTLTGVEVSPDLRHARVFVSTLGEASSRASSIVALNRAASFFRRAVAREAGLKRTPEIRFEEDATLEGGSRVEQLLDEIHREDSGPERRGPGEGPGE